jgi:RNA polymerase sigma factor (sigma-70 family)
VEGRPLDETEAGLVESARRGDVAAYEALVRQYQEVAFRVAYTIVGSADEAEDAAQEGFVRAYRAFPRFRAGAPFRPWLLTIVANAARSRHTAVARRPSLALSAAEDHPSDDSAQSPEVAALVADQRRELLAAVNALRDDDRKVIAFRYFLDLSEAETADLLGCARGTVKSRLSRATQRLRQHLLTNARDTSAVASTIEAEGGTDA